MAKLALLLATFALAFLVVNASIYRITVDSDENRPDSCQDKIRRLDNLRQCQRYLEESSEEGGRYNRPGRQQLDLCCEQLENLDENCQCQGLKEAVREQVQWVEREEVQGIYKVAERIMKRYCDVKPETRRRCNIRSPSWF